MKNILKQKPTEELYGRLLASVNYVPDSSIHGKNVLNIGCGYGWCELDFLKRGVGNMLGTELSEEDLRTAKNAIKNPRVTFTVGSAINLPIPDESFDTVVSWEVIEHIPKHTEQKMFLEIARVLKSNGIMYLSTPHRAFFSNILDPAWWLMGHRHYTKNSLRGYAENSNLTVLQIEVKGGIWVIISSLNMYFSKWILRRGILFKDFFIMKENEEYGRPGHANLFISAQKIK